MMYNPAFLQSINFLLFHFQNKLEIMKSIPILLIFVLLVTINNGHSLPYCEESSCGNGPTIRFPFRLKHKQPHHCGYQIPAFDLSCTPDNHTLLQLPNSLHLYVTAIDYVSQLLTISRLHDFFLKQARNISLSGTPFQFYQQSPSDFSLFNCSPSVVYPVDCLPSTGYTVQAVDLGRLSENPWLVSCTKMFNVLSAPKDLFVSRVNNLQLTWSEPACGKCEAKGGKCELEIGFNKPVAICNNITKQNISMWLLISGGISLLIVLGFAAVFLFNRSQKKKANEARIEKFLEDYEALTLTRYSYSDLKRITDRFKVKLGQGAYGEAFKGKISDEILVAVKILRNSFGNGDDFIDEVATLSSIHHVNVIRLVGFCAERFYRAFVYEFLPNGSLEKFIFSNDPNGNRNSLGWKKLQDIALGIAKGIEYLHQGCDRRILHFDIKPHNILLDENFTPKIADFGLSKLCSKDQSVVSMTNAQGTMGYIAPEVFSRNFGNVSYKSDVYSFGMLLLEMVGGRKSIHANNEEQSNHVFFPERIYDHLERGEELEIQIVEEGDAQIVRKLTIVGLRCIQWYSVYRPSMTSVVQMLEGDGNDLEMPPNPFASNNGVRNMDANGISARVRKQSELAVISEIE